MVEAQLKQPDSKEPTEGSAAGAGTNNGQSTTELAAKPKSRKEKKENSKRGKKNKKDLLKALTKVIVRRLPPSMDEETFRKQIDPIPDHDDFYFVSGDWSLGKNASSRAYINFTRAEDIFLFKDKFDGYIFVDTKGVEYPAVVEFAPFQELPRNRSRKKDGKCSTIETDTHFLAFKEALEAEEKESAGKSKSKLEYSYKIKDEKKITSTPLLEFIAQKKQEKREEKRRKMEEKKKQRKEERQKKTQTSKALPEAIKEEKGAEDDIVVRTVPSRLDPNQGKKDGNKRSNEKNESPKEVKDKEKKQRNRKEKDKERVKQEKGEGGPEQEKTLSRKQERDRQRKEKEKARKQEEKEKKAQGESVKKEKEPPSKIENTAQKTTIEAPKKEVKKYSERRKETRARAETRFAELEERKQGHVANEQLKTIPNIQKVDVKKSVLTPHVAPFIPKEKSTIILGESSASLPPAFPQKCVTPTPLLDERKESTPAPDTPAADSSSSERKLDIDEKIKEAREARKIRNKDRPSIEIYQPRKRLMSGTAGGSKDGVKSEDDKAKEKSDSDRSSDKSLRPGPSGARDKEKRHKLTKKASDRERPRDRRSRRKNSSDVEGEKEKKIISRKNSREEPPPAEPAPIKEKTLVKNVTEVVEAMEGIKLDS